jgi:triphosphoribosyl-dephospho-CoA synthetase
VKVPHPLLEELAHFRVTFEIGSLEPLEVVKLLREHLANNDNINQVHQTGFEINTTLGSCLQEAFEPRSCRPLTSSGSGSGTIY